MNVYGKLTDIILKYKDNCVPITSFWSRWITRKAQYNYLWTYADEDGFSVSLCHSYKGFDVGDITISYRSNGDVEYYRMSHFAFDRIKPKEIHRPSAKDSIRDTIYKAIKDLS